MAAQLMAMKLVAAARAQLVQRARQHFFAGAAFAEQQHAGVSRADFLDATADLLHGRAAGDDAGQRRGDLAGQPLILRFEFRQHMGALDNQAQNVRIDGLLIEIIGALRHRPHRDLAVVVAGDHHYLGLGRELQHFTQRRQALRGVRRIRWQAQVECHHWRLGLTQRRQGGFAVTGDRDLVVLEIPPELLLQAGVVVDDQEFALVHQCPVAIRASGCS